MPVQREAGKCACGEQPVPPPRGARVLHSLLRGAVPRLQEGNAQGGYSPIPPRGTHILVCCGGGREKQPIPERVKYRPGELQGTETRWVRIGVMARSAFSGTMRCVCHGLVVSERFTVKSTSTPTPETAHSATERQRPCSWSCTHGWEGG